MGNTTYRCAHLAVVLVLLHCTAIAGYNATEDSPSGVPAPYPTDSLLESYPPLLGGFSLTSLTSFSSLRLLLVSPCCHQLMQEVILGLCPSRLLRAGSPTVGRLSSNKELPVLSRLVSLSEVDLLRQADLSCSDVAARGLVRDLPASRGGVGTCVYPAALRPHDQQQARALALQHECKNVVLSSPLLSLPPPPKKGDGVTSPPPELFPLPLLARGPRKARKEG